MYEEWPTIDEVSEKTKLSKRSIQRRIESGELTKGSRNVPGRRPLTVVDPQDVEKLTQQTLTPVPVPRPREPRQSELAQALVALASTVTPRHGDTGANGAVPVERKIFLTLKEAVAFSGLTEAHLRRLLKSKRLKCVMSGGYRLRRTDLERL